MKKVAKNKIFRNLGRGLAVICLSAGVFMLPVAGSAEQQVTEAAPQKYVMPREQVYLDPSQVEAAKKQLEADAKYNSGQQNTAAVAAPEKKEVKEAVEEKPAKDDSKQQPAAASREKYVMPEEQVYLDPSQVEAAKKQKEADALANSQPQAKNVEVVTGDRVIADVKVVEQDKKEAAPEAEKGAAKQEAVKEKTDTPKAGEGNVTRSEAKTGGAAAENKNENKAATVQPEPVPPKKPFRLSRFGQIKEFTTHHATVGEVLREIITDLEGRAVYPPPETKITDNMVIHVLARRSFLSREEVEVPFATQIINDPELAYGTRKVEKEGVKGKDLVVYENITFPGLERKFELDRRRVAEPVNEVVRQGVAQSVLTPEGYVRYRKKIYGEATAYTWGGGATGHTSIGLWPKRGIVAVDPRVIPYYTKLYIPGYGMAIAGDTGGAIVGARIDLFMDSLHECFQWGRRGVEIYILE